MKKFLKFLTLFIIFQIIPLQKSPQHSECFATASTLSTFRPEKLNIRLDKRHKKSSSDPFREAYQLLKQHCLWRNDYNEKEWKNFEMIFFHDNSSNPEQAIRKLFTSLKDPYARAIGRPLMEQREYRMQGLQVGFGLQLSRRIAPLYEWKKLFKLFLHSYVDDIISIEKFHHIIKQMTSTSISRLSHTKQQPVDYNNKQQHMSHTNKLSTRLWGSFRLQKLLYNGLVIVAATYGVPTLYRICKNHPFNWPTPWRHMYWLHHHFEMPATSLSYSKYAKKHVYLMLLCSMLIYDAATRLIPLLFPVELIGFERENSVCVDHRRFNIHHKLLQWFHLHHKKDKDPPEQYLVDVPLIEENIHHDEKDEVMKDVNFNGLRIGDRIVSINGQSIGLSSTNSIESMVDKGDAGEKLHFGILRSITNPQPSLHCCEVVVERDYVFTSNVKCAYLRPHEELLQKQHQMKGSNIISNLFNRIITICRRITSNTLRNSGSYSYIGYISIDEFTDVTYSDVQLGLKLLKNTINTRHNAVMEGIIFDLRGNPGGPLVPALDIASIFLRKGTCVLQATGDRRAKYRDKYYSLNRRPDLHTAILILVNSNTASASEILTEALCDNKRAVSMGVRTVGKNLAQALLSLSDGTGICFSVREFFTPNGRYMGHGHEPNVMVPNWDIDLTKLYYNRSTHHWQLYK